MWISEPTPVISSTKVSDSGSISNPKSMSSEPDWIQVNTETSCTRSVAASPSTLAKITNPSTKAAITVSVTCSAAPAFASTSL